MEKIIQVLEGWNNVSICVRLLLAFICGMILGLRPEYKHRPAGMRTHILVCLGSATATMTGFFVYYKLGSQVDPLRVGAQVISGIGFLGVGTIMVIGRSQVRGLTTAAGLWTCAAVGIAYGAGFYLGGIVCTALALITIMTLETLEKNKIRTYKRVDIYLEITDVSTVNSVAEQLRNPKYCIYNMQIKAARSEIADNLGVEATINLNRNLDIQEVLNEIASLENVAFAIESE